MIDWGEIGLPQEAIEATWLMPWKNATEQQHDFYEERDFLEQKGCCVVQEEPDGDSQRKG